MTALLRRDRDRREGAVGRSIAFALIVFSFVADVVCVQPLARRELIPGKELYRVRGLSEKLALR